MCPPDNEQPSLPAADPLCCHWYLDDDVVFLNHGSFGACPGPVLGHQRALQLELERQPLRFFVRRLPRLQQRALASVARFVGAEAEDLAFVPNATAGVNCVLRSLALSPGDQLLTTDHAYNACKNALQFVARAAGAEVVVARVPFPICAPDQVHEAVLEAAGPRTRLALVDHVTSPTGLIFPVQRLVRALQARGVDVLVDGAHAPGMIPLELDALGAAYYTGNLHKWACAPKGAAFLHVRRDRQRQLRPLAISHGASSPRRDRSRFSLEFSWTGTHDPSPYLCAPAAQEFLGTLLPGALPALMDRNHELCLQAREVLCEALEVPAPCPTSMVGSLASIPLPPGAGGVLDAAATDPLQDLLRERYRIEVQVYPWPAPPHRLLRVSAQAYNSQQQYEYLARAVAEVLDC